MLPGAGEPQEAGGTRQSPASIPFYPHRRSGTAIVCGFAPSLFADLEEAKRLRPEAAVIAVNQAATAIPAFAIFSLHHGPEKLGQWAKVQHETFGRCEVHGHSTALENLAGKRKAYPYVDYWWAEAKGVGTSAWAARRLAALMGYGEVILAGVALEQRVPYANNTMARDFRDPRVIKIYRDFIKNDTAYHAGTYAMSGWPRTFFGAPA